jgi:hypothetical protein
MGSLSEIVGNEIERRKETRAALSPLTGSTGERHHLTLSLYVAGRKDDETLFLENGGPGFFYALAFETDALIADRWCSSVIARHMGFERVWA